jgi:hypothetical protein
MGGKGLRQRPERFAEQPFDDPLRLRSGSSGLRSAVTSDWTTLTIRPWISGLAQLAVRE